MISKAHLSFQLLQIRHAFVLYFFPQGIIQGQEEFADGLTFGVRSMVGHTIGQLIICITVKNQEMYHYKYTFVIEICKTLKKTKKKLECVQ